LAASQGKLNERVEQDDETQEVISWYNRDLGFHVKSGRGNWLALFFCTMMVFSSAIDILTSFLLFRGKIHIQEYKSEQSK